MVTCDGIFEVTFKYDDKTVSEGDVLRELQNFLKDKFKDRVFILIWKPKRPK